MIGCKPFRVAGIVILAAATFLHLPPLPAWCQDQAERPSDSAADDSLSIWPHSGTSRFWISGQANIVLQGHPAFHAEYSGENSLRPRGEYKTSLLETLYLGAQVTRNTELLLDIESAGGRGIGQALGLAGFTNLDVVRNPTLSAAPYVARIELHQIVPLSRATDEATRGPLSLSTLLPVRRLEFRIGKMGTIDSFDANDAANDSHSQFLNWTIDNSGAFDYAADTRGYTYGAIAEYRDRLWGVRFGEMLMPEVANGIHLVWNLRRARAENIEFELHRAFLPRKPGAIRFLTFVNHANMGAYQEAVGIFLSGRTPIPEITAHPLRTAVKYGFGANFEQQVTANLRLLGRWGWNEGQHESYAYTEVDETALGGGDYRGEKWGRRFDRFGLAFVSNGISASHQKYLALGGSGFLLGDGRLTYGWENILEAYYNAHLWGGIFFSVDLQSISHPGYNRDRGPVFVPGSRLHVDF